MCEMCDESPLGYETCQFCSRMVCYDVEQGDDIIRPAVATAGGDLACDRCAAAIEAEEDRQAERDEWLYGWESYPGELLATDVDFDSDAA